MKQYKIAVSGGCFTEKGANIYAYDPVGENNYKKKYPTEINYVKTPEEALKDANVCFIFT